MWAWSEYSLKEAQTFPETGRWYLAKGMYSPHLLTFCFCGDWSLEVFWRSLGLNPLLHQCSLRVSQRTLFLCKGRLTICANWAWSPEPISSPQGMLALQEGASHRTLNPFTHHWEGAMAGRAFPDRTHWSPLIFLRIHRLHMAQYFNHGQLDFVFPQCLCTHPHISLTNYFFL